MTALEFFMPMKPPTITDQEHRLGVNKAGKPFVYQDAELAAAKAKLHDHLAPYAPKKPFDGALRLYTKWCFPVIQGKHDGQPRNTKPDTDNLQKALKDQMESLHFFVNDSRVAEEFIGKYWAEIPGIWIRLEEIEND